jgi:Family of unknown function (DUF6370)
MKNIQKIFIAINLIAISLGTVAQTTTINEEQKLQIVEASCGQCNFGMKGKSCDLAIKINGKAYFVEGTKIDDHGDAHASDGFCMTIKKAEVKGEIVGEKFIATHFKLVKEEKKKD